MRRRAGTGRAEGQLAGIGLGVGDQLGGVARRHRRIGHHDVGRRRDQRDRAQFARHLEGSALPARLTACLAARKRKDRSGRGHQQGVAVGGGTDHLARADQAGGAGPIVGDDGLAPQRLQMRRQHAAEHVGRAAGRERHDDAHLAGRKVLCARPRPGEQQRQRRKRQATRDHATLNSRRAPDTALRAAPRCRSAHGRAPRAPPQDPRRSTCRRRPAPASRPSSAPGCAGTSAPTC